MKKKMTLLILMIFMLCGCTIRNDKYYLKIADITINFFRDDTFNIKNIRKEDLNAVKEYLSTINHIDQKINVDEIMNEYGYSVTSEQNSSKIIVENNTCYMNYTDVYDEFQKFYRENDRPVIDAYYKVNCNGRSIVLYENMFYPDYQETKKNPRFDYVLYDYYEEDGDYIYIYRSSYDGTGLKMTLVLENKKLVKIETEIIKVD